MKDGQPIELDMTPDDALKWMSEQPHYANLFINPAVPGLGGRGGEGSNRPFSLNAKTSMADYRRNREKLGLGG
jgi:hypothetical protein